MSVFTGILDYGDGGEFTRYYQYFTPNMGLYPNTFILD
ncbi:hypothetical protein CCAN11_1710014 [Capnocytophaga canimorsus]|uniref:Uncharacterized protein n=1 Tax=Capnocytophaga canimorsus TaxID=28188 RepID=A0A0B7I8V5_9FLAO|nr:hypothetical protein CCAN11_1710014 [Capnocytophaga canimorsus]